ncbi:hypothetical protein NP233_g6016 [Leucocoprinus birnbaumii]|uniref:Uncharacterized protein n=1 Tax=Leucocoprinus birnbaumii TaxID=56174 RepID=A0AAD5VRV0_9AGAR|nr:hypothetical protein NP233_g6016 [Leucocoprinus birnbaumii]
MSDGDEEDAESSPANTTPIPFQGDIFGTAIDYHDDDFGQLGSVPAGLEMDVDEPLEGGVNATLQDKEQAFKADSEVEALPGDTMEEQAPIARSNPPLQSPDNPYSPFSSEVNWEIARWAKLRGPSSTAFSELLAIEGVCEKLGLSYKTADDLNQKIEEHLPGRPQFHRREIVVGGESFEFYSRDILECIKALWRDPQFANDLIVEPERHYVDEDETVRMYHDMHTGKWWWNTQKALDRTGQTCSTVIPIMLSSNKTQLTQFRNKVAYPVYLTIGNLPKHIRRKPSQQGQILLAYLPTTKLEHITNQTSRRRTLTNMFHACLKFIVQPLEKAGKEGEYMLSGDGLIRRCFPILATYIGDYPEQVLVTLVKTGECPVCEVGQDELGNLDCVGSPRALEPILSALWQLETGNAQGFVDACADAGIKPVLLPFWKDLPFVNIYSSITPDILHQLYQGVLKHVISWLHFCGHYHYLIELFGTTDNYNTEYTEQLHIDYAKDAYRATNFRDELPQMTTWLDHKERILQHAQTINQRLEQKSGHMSTSLHTCVDSQPILRPLPCLVYKCIPQLPKLPTVGSVTFEDIRQQYGASFFEPALCLFVAHYQNPTFTRAQLEQASYLVDIRFYKVPVYHYLKFVTHDPYALPNSPLMVVDAIYAKPGYKNKKGEAIPGQFDTAIIDTASRNETGAIEKVTQDAKPLNHAEALELATIKPVQSTMSTHDEKVVEKDVARAPSIDDDKVKYTEDGDSIIEGSEGVTQKDLETYRHVADRLPMSAWLVVIVEFAERWTYYGTTNVYNNYIRAGLPPGSTTGAVIAANRDVGVAGALGLGVQKSFAVRTFNTFFVYVTPWIGGVLADTVWGRYKTILIFSIVTLMGHIILVGSAVPSSLQHPNSALGLLVLSIVVMGIGAGAIKSNVSPMIAEQYTGKLRKETLPSGEIVIKSPAVTVQSIYLWFYAAINFGSCGAISAAFLARDHGYWPTFLVPTGIFCLVPLVLLFGKKYYVLTPPRGSILLETFRVIGLALGPRWSLNPITTIRNIRAPDFWDPAKPSFYEAGKVPAKITWDDEFVGEVGRTLNACNVFFFFPFYWLCYSQIDGNLGTMAAAMTLHGTPNDLIQNLNPISIIIMIPIFDYVIYPFLRRRGINFSPIKRIYAGFLVAGLAMVYAAVLQHYLFKMSPCHDNEPSECLDPVSGNPLPAPINVWVVSGPYILVGMSEIFASITSLEYAFTKAPKRMRSVVMALSQFQNALSSALNFALISVNVEPKFAWLFGSFAVTVWVIGTIFFIVFRDLDRREAELNQIGVGERKGFSDE